MRLRVATAFVALVVASGCAPEPPAPEDQLIARGRDLFFNETFDGNGRTCGTCHRAERNFTLDPGFIATLPDDDPLFVAEFNPNLSENFENPRLMREFGLIVENLNGFANLDSVFTMRGIPHTLALPTSIDHPDGPRLGWSGDGSPGDGSLRSFAIGAVIQHFTKSLDRVAGEDFRLPTEEELDAMEAFQASLGRQTELELPLPLKSVRAIRGQEIFMDPTLGKCTFCHQNAGANVNTELTGLTGNRNFDTGVEDLPDRPQDATGELVPPDDGFGFPGDGTFNTPPLVEAADTPPFFHDNSVETIEGAVEFYDGETFNGSPAGQFLASIDPEGTGIELEVTQIMAVASFLRVINALENVRQTVELLELIAGNRYLGGRTKKEVLVRAAAETNDAIGVLAGAVLHPDAVVELREAHRLIVQAQTGRSSRSLARQAIEELERARSRLIES